MDWLNQAINPTLTINVGDILKLPYNDFVDKLPLDISRMLQIAKNDWDSFETSWDFQSLPMLADGLRQPTLAASYAAWERQCRDNIQTMQSLEEENNRLFIEAYGLQEELSPAVPEEQITLARPDRAEDIKRLVSYAIGCMMGRYSLDEPGLVYAQAGNEGFDPTRYARFPADDDGIIPLTDIDWFADDPTNRFAQFLAVAWPKEQERENLAFVAESLDQKRGELPLDVVRRYLNRDFFKDHLKTYKKRPIYWLFSSGKEKAFECLVYLHRYHRGTLSRMRMEYVTPLQSRMRGRVEQLLEEITAAPSTVIRNKAQKTLDKLRKQQEELALFDERVRHYADQRITLDLDDGVKVNYGKFGNLLAEVAAITGAKGDD